MNLHRPTAFYGDVIGPMKTYYNSSYTMIKSADASTVVLVHDGFMLPDFWTGSSMFPNTLPSSDQKRVIFDTHVYQVFLDNQIEMSENAHLGAACGQAHVLQEYPAGGVIVGEWSPAKTDCAKYLNGRGVGARYDGTLSYDQSPAVGSCDGMSGDASAFSDDYKVFLRKFWEAQADSYESGGLGWIQWAWKTEEGAGEEWSYEKGLEYGWIPQDPTDRTYPGQCNH